MDPLTKHHQIPLFKPSFPLFNVDLINQEDFEPFIPDLLPIEKISEMIQKKIHQEINLNGDFELFEKKEKKKYKPSHKLCPSTVRAKNLKQDNNTSISLETKSQLKPLKLKRTGKKLFKTALSKHHLGQNSSPNKRARDSLKREATEPYNFPSLASILEGDEESSADETDYSFGGFRSNDKVKIETEDRSAQLFRLDLFGKNSPCPLVEESSNFEKTLEPFSCDVSLFSKLFSETNQFQAKKSRNKKVKENPRGIEGNYQAFNLFSSVAGNKKMGSFELALEKDSLAKAFNVPIEIQLDENTALGLNSNIVLTK